MRLDKNVNVLKIKKWSTSKVPGKIVMSSGCPSGYPSDRGTGGIKRKVGLSTSWSPGYEADFDQDDFPPPARTVRVSDLIRNLQTVLERNGDVPLCISDANYMSPIDENSLRLKIVNSNEYNFTIGLESPQYLSVLLKL